MRKLDMHCQSCMWARSCVLCGRGNFFQLTEDIDENSKQLIVLSYAFISITI